MTRIINGREYPDDLSGADLSVADLSGADLSGADLRDASLSGADLRDADLRGADLRDANLSVANLSGADLSGANLRYANLSVADLSGADLSGADLRDASLSGANLSDADLRDANLSDADLRDATNLSDLLLAQTSICAEGDIIGYKKLHGGVICKLKIPADARRSNATGRKCRAEYAVVLEGEGASQHDHTFKYTVGDTVRPTAPFDECRWNECAPGIHFYLTRAEAEDY